MWTARTGEQSADGADRRDRIEVLDLSSCGSVTAGGRTIIDDRIDEHTIPF
jgi:hypothetical protein